MARSSRTGRAFSAAWSWSARTERSSLRPGALRKRTRCSHRLDLRNKVVLVTGAGRRVGRAIAERLARDGARMAIHYHSSGREADAVVQATGGHGFPADLTDPAAAS